MGRGLKDARRVVMEDKHRSKDMRAHSKDRSLCQTPNALPAVSGSFCREEASGIW